MRLVVVQGFGALAQLGERLICIQEVIGSIPIGSTNRFCSAKAADTRQRVALGGSVAVSLREQTARERVLKEKLTSSVRSLSTFECLAVQLDANLMVQLTSFIERTTTLLGSSAYG